MMKRMLGLPDDPCATAGKVSAGKLAAARAAVENSLFLRPLLIFIASAPIFKIVTGEQADFRSPAGCCKKRCHWLPARAPVDTPSMSTFPRLL
jgi:hypothetical protein